MADANTVTADLAVLGGTGWVPTGNPKYGGAIPSAISCLWANRPTAGLIAGQLIFVSDVGEFGTIMQWTGARWRPLNGTASLKNLAAPSANIAAVETNVLQTLLPINLLQVGDVLRLWLAATKSGTTDSLNLTVRMGTAGTTGDTAITGLSAFAIMGATGVAGGAIFDIKMISSTSAQKQGTSNTQNGTYSALLNSGAESAATAITDAAANALYVSVALASTGATNTVKATSAQLHLITS